MKQHSNKFLDADHPGMDIWHKLYYAMTSTLEHWFRILKI